MKGDPSFHGPSWDELAALENSLRPVLDPQDAIGAKNRLMDSIHWSALRSQLLRSGSVLDLGCGNGRMAKRILKLGLSYTGVDTSIKMIHCAKKMNAPQLSDLFKWYTGPRLPFADGQFDALFTLGVFQYVIGGLEERVFVDEMRRVLRPNAHMIMIEQASVSGQSSASVARSSTPDDYRLALEQHFDIEFIRPVRSAEFSSATRKILLLAEKMPPVCRAVIPLASRLERLRISRLREDYFRSIRYFEILIAGRAS